MRSYDFLRSTAFAAVALLSVLSSASAQTNNDAERVTLLRDFRPLDNAGNNRKHPDYNCMPGSPELAYTWNVYAPGTQDGLMPGPNPRRISNIIGGGQAANGDDADTTDATASAWLYVFGQFIDHDLSLEASPQDGPAIDIKVAAGDPAFSNGAQIPMTRVTRDPNTGTITNETDGYLDLSQLYGSTPEEAATLIDNNGMLKTSNNGMYLPVADGGFYTGDPRVMENPELTATTTLFMREHNYWVRQLGNTHPHWSAVQRYQMARAITTAEYQNIIYNEYLPVLIGPMLGNYRGYDPDMPAQVTQEFTLGAFRVGHSQVSDTQEGVDNQGNVTFSQPLSEAFMNTAQQDINHGFDSLFRGISTDFSQATDVYLVGTLRNLLFAPLPGGDIDLMDLMAIDIQRERDAGVGSLNQVRSAMHLRPYRNFADLTNDLVLQANLKSVYGDIDKVDLFVGGMAEAHAPGAVVGPTFQQIIASQFHALRTGDRYFWENQDFDDHTERMIRNTRLSDIIRRNSDTTTLQDEVFLAPVPKLHDKSHRRSHQLDHARHRE